MNCNNCNNLLPENATVCSNCGVAQEVKGVEVQPTQQPTQSAPQPQMPPQMPTQAPAPPQSPVKPEEVKEFITKRIKLSKLFGILALLIFVESKVVSIIFAVLGLLLALDIEKKFQLDHLTQDDQKKTKIINIVAIALPCVYVVIALFASLLGASFLSSLF